MSASVCGTGSFSAHTATQLNEREWPMRNKLFVLNYRNYRYCCNCLPQAVPNGNLALFFFIYPNYSKIYFHFSAHTATQLNERERPMRNKLFVLNYGNYRYYCNCLPRAVPNGNLALSFSIYLNYSRVPHQSEMLSRLAFTASCL